MATAVVRTVTFAGDHQLTQPFGVNPDAYSRFGLAGHNGVDFGCWTGTEIYAPEDGTIVEAYHDVGGYGLTTYLSATSGRGWRHGHLLRLDVQVGDQVRKGQRIGTSNNTGNSSGPHLHLGMRPPNPNYANGFNGYVDPTSTLQQLKEESAMDGTIAELNRQIEALRTEIASKDSTIGALQAHEIAPLKARVTQLEGLLAAVPAAPAPIKIRPKLVRLHTMVEYEDDSVEALPLELRP